MEGKGLKLDMTKLNTQIQEIKRKFFDWDDFYIRNEGKTDFSELKVITENKWSFVVIKPEIFLDYDNNCKGFDIIKKIEGDESSNDIIFVLTEFENMDNPPSIWYEDYSSEKIACSNESSWQFAGAGLFFTPRNKNWFGLFVDNPGQDFIVFAAPDEILQNACFKLEFCEHVIDFLAK